MYFNIGCQLGSFKQRLIVRYFPLLLLRILALLVCIIVNSDDSTFHQDFRIVAKHNEKIKLVCKSLRCFCIAIMMILYDDHSSLLEAYVTKSEHEHA